MDRGVGVVVRRFFGGCLHFLWCLVAVFFCGYLELGQLLDGGRRRSNINDFLVAVKASFRER